MNLTLFCFSLYLIWWAGPAIKYHDDILIADLIQQNPRNKIFSNEKKRIFCKKETKEGKFLLLLDSPR